MVKEHKTMKTDDDEPNRKDLVDILLKLQKTGMLNIELNQDNLKGILLVSLSLSLSFTHTHKPISKVVFPKFQDMFVGESDTTSTTLEWLMAELIKKPNIMKRVQKEVRKVVGQKSKIDANDINHMNYLKYILKETLRLHPPAPFSLPREISASVKFRGYDIPPKTRVFINL